MEIEYTHLSGWNLLISLVLIFFIDIYYCYFSPSNILDPNVELALHAWTNLPGHGLSPSNSMLSLNSIKIGVLNCS